MTKARTLADNYAADINQVSAGVGITGGGTSGTVTITNDMATTIAAKGDLVVGTGNDTYNRLAVASTAGYVLTVDSAETTGLKWAAPGGGANWSLLNTGGTSLSGATRITVSSISGKDKILILLNDASAGNGAGIMLEINSDTAANYHTYGTGTLASNTYNASNFYAFYTNGNNIHLANQSNNTDGKVFGYVLLSGCNSSGKKVYQANNGATKGSGIDPITYNTGGFYDSASAVSSVTLYSTNGNFDNGTMYVYVSA
jgi:hypothetical protein